jgi:hypothetical protein
METFGPIAQGVVPWRERRVEVVLIVASLLAVLVALILAIWYGQPHWVERASAAPLVASAVLAYRSLRHSYEKVRNAHLRLVRALQKGGGFPGWLSTSSTQKAIDRWTIVLLVVGTIMASFGDVLVEWISPW